MSRMRAIVASANIDRTGLRYAECGGNARRAHVNQSRLNLFLIDLLGEPHRLIGRVPRGFHAGEAATHNSFSFYCGWRARRGLGRLVWQTRPTACCTTLPSAEFSATRAADSQRPWRFGRLSWRCTLGLSTV